MTKRFNPYDGFSVKVGAYVFHASPGMLTVWLSKRLVDGPVRLPDVPLSKQALTDAAYRWIADRKEEVRNRS